jgi:prevent-host-death family protein
MWEVKKMTMVRLPASVVRASFADLINRVAYAGERVVVTRREKPIAVLIPIADFERLEAAREPVAPPSVPEQPLPRETPEVPADLLAELRREVYEQARREVYEQVRSEAQKRLESLIAGRRETP